MKVDAVAHRIDRRLGREAGLPAANARDFAHDLANGDGAVGGGDRIGGGASDLELVGAAFGEHDVGLDAGFFQCRDDARANGSARRSAATDSGCADGKRSEEHTSALQSLMRISYAV